eukprot:GHVR01090958.1.p1 GENE.GHVR01090958.1~~GHVR01090958.1.p1  ORF type:complete len:463 (+),score=175.67 GHVR01090958.1:202-1590(+)
MGKQTGLRVAMLRQRAISNGVYLIDDGEDKLEELEAAKREAMKMVEEDTQRCCPSVTDIDEMVCGVMRDLQEKEKEKRRSLLKTAMQRRKDLQKYAKQFPLDTNTQNNTDTHTHTHTNLMDDRVTSDKFRVLYPNEQHDLEEEFYPTEDVCVLSRALLVASTINHHNPPSVSLHNVCQYCPALFWNIVRHHIDVETFLRDHVPPDQLRDRRRRACVMPSSPLLDALRVRLTRPDYKSVCLVKDINRRDHIPNMRLMRPSNEPVSRVERKEETHSEPDVTHEHSLLMLKRMRAVLRHLNKQHMINLRKEYLNKYKRLQIFNDNNIYNNNNIINDNNTETHNNNNTDTHTRTSNQTHTRSGRVAVSTTQPLVDVYVGLNGSHRGDISSLTEQQKKTVYRSCIERYILFIFIYTHIYTHIHIQTQTIVNTHTHTPLLSMFIYTHCCKNILKVCNNIYNNIYIINK